MAKKESSRLKLDNLDLLNDHFNKTPEKKEKEWKGISLYIDTYYFSLFNEYNNQYFIQTNKEKGYIHMANKFYIRAYETFRDHFLKEMDDSINTIDDETLNYLTRTGRRAAYSLDEKEEGNKKNIQLTISVELWKEMYSFIYLYYQYKENRRNFHIYSLTYLLGEILLWLREKENWEKLIK